MPDTLSIMLQFHGSILVSSARRTPSVMRLQAQIYSRCFYTSPSLKTLSVPFRCKRRRPCGFRRSIKHCCITTRGITWATTCHTLLGSQVSCSPNLIEISASHTHSHTHTCARRTTHACTNPRTRATNPPTAHLPPSHDHA